MTYLRGPRIRVAEPLRMSVFLLLQVIVEAVRVLPGLLDIDPDPDLGAPAIAP
jgi:hypothetical protein